MHALGVPVWTAFIRLIMESLLEHLHLPVVCLFRRGVSRMKNGRHGERNVTAHFIIMGSLRASESQHAKVFMRLRHFH